MICVKDSVDQEILGEFADEGFSLELVEYRPGDSIFEIYFKGAPTKRRFSELWTTPEDVRKACKQFKEGFNEPVP
jgi:hypothetical protein